MNGRPAIFKDAWSTIHFWAMRALPPSPAAFYERDEVLRIIAATPHPAMSSP
jgi:hypothetical protein